jgi:hypothetical protein
VQVLVVAVLGGVILWVSLGAAWEVLCPCGFWVLWIPLCFLFCFLSFGVFLYTSYVLGLCPSALLIYITLLIKEKFILPYYLQQLIFTKAVGSTWLYT